MQQQTICSAIKDRKLLNLRYEGDLQARTFAPYVLYKAATGNILVGGYQLMNPAKPMERNQWRELDTGDLKTLSLTDDNFTPDRSFNPLNKRYAGRTICHVFENV